MENERAWTKDIWRKNTFLNQYQSWAAHSIDAYLCPIKKITEYTHFEENVQKQLTGIYKQTKQMKNIINMVLDVRKMEVGQINSKSILIL